jgi:acylphosphatase
MTPPEARCHAYVSGVVQGVGFRYFVVDVAARLRIAGWVRNLRDGRVELIGEGSRADLGVFLGEIRRGPRGARVDQVDVDWPPATGEFSSFRLERTS